MDGNEAEQCSGNGLSDTVDRIIKIIQPELEMIDPKNVLLEYKLIDRPFGFQYVPVFNKKYMGNGSLSEAVTAYRSDLEKEITRIKKS